MGSLQCTVPQFRNADMFDEQLAWSFENWGVIGPDRIALRRNVSGSQPEQPIVLQIVKFSQDTAVVDGLLPWPTTAGWDPTSWQSSQSAFGASAVPVWSTDDKDAFCIIGYRVALCIWDKNTKEGYYPVASIEGVSNSFTHAEFFPEHSVLLLWSPGSRMIGRVRIDGESMGALETFQLPSTGSGRSHHPVRMGPSWTLGSGGRQYWISPEPFEIISDFEMDENGPTEFDHIFKIDDGRWIGYFESNASFSPIAAKRERSGLYICNSLGSVLKYETLAGHRLGSGIKQPNDSAWRIKIARFGQQMACVSAPLPGKYADSAEVCPVGFTFTIDAGNNIHVDRDDFARIRHVADNGDGTTQTMPVSMFGGTDFELMDVNGSLWMGYDQVFDYGSQFNYEARPGGWVRLTDIPSTHDRRWFDSGSGVSRPPTATDVSDVRVVTEDEVSTIAPFSTQESVATIIPTVRNVPVRSSVLTATAWQGRQEVTRGAVNDNEQTDENPAPATHSMPVPLFTNSDDEPIPLPGRPSLSYGTEPVVYPTSDYESGIPFHTVLAPDNFVHCGHYNFSNSGAMSAGACNLVAFLSTVNSFPSVTWAPMVAQDAVGSSFAGYGYYEGGGMASRVDLAHSWDIESPHGGLAHFTDLAMLAVWNTAEGLRVAVAEYAEPVAINRVEYGMAGLVPSDTPGYSNGFGPSLIATSDALISSPDFSGDFIDYTHTVHYRHSVRVVSMGPKVVLVAWVNTSGQAKGRLVTRDGNRAAFLGQEFDIGSGASHLVIKTINASTAMVGYMVGGEIRLRRLSLEGTDVSMTSFATIATGSAGRSFGFFVARDFVVVAYADGANVLFQQLGMDGSVLIEPTVVRSDFMGRMWVELAGWEDGRGIIFCGEGLENPHVINDEFSTVDVTLTPGTGTVFYYSWSTGVFRLEEETRGPGYSASDYDGLWYNPYIHILDWHQAFLSDVTFFGRDGWSIHSLGRYVPSNHLSTRGAGEKNCVSRSYNVADHVGQSQFTGRDSEQPFMADIVNWNMDGEYEIGPPVIYASDGPNNGIPIIPDFAPSWDGNFALGIGDSWVDGAYARLASYYQVTPGQELGLIGRIPTHAGPFSPGCAFFTRHVWVWCVAPNVWLVVEHVLTDSQAPGWVNNIPGSMLLYLVKGEGAALTIGPATWMRDVAVMTPSEGSLYQENEFSMVDHERRIGVMSWSDRGDPTPIDSWSERCYMRALQFDYSNLTITWGEIYKNPTEKFGEHSLMKRVDGPTGMFVNAYGPKPETGAG